MNMQKGTTASDTDNTSGSDIIITERWFRMLKKEKAATKL